MRVLDDQLVTRPAPLQVSPGVPPTGPVVAASRGVSRVCVPGEQALLAAQNDSAAGEHWHSNTCAMTRSPVESGHGEGGDMATISSAASARRAPPPPLPVAAPIGPDEAVSVGARRVAAALAEPARTQGRDEWLGVVGDCQSLINTLTAVQDTAIAEAARRESVWCEDGTLGETVHAPGRVSLDAADLVAPVIGASHAPGPAPGRAGGAAGRRVGSRCRPTTVTCPRPAGWAGCTRRWRPGSSTATGPGSSRSSSRSLPPTWPTRSWPHSAGHLGDDAADPAAPHPGAAERASPPTCCASAPSAPGPRPGCAGGSPSPASTSGTAPSPAKTPPPPGPPSTGSPTTSSPPAPAPTSNRPAARP